MNHALRFEKIGPSGVITLNKPQTLNSFDHEIILRLHAYIDQAVSDHTITHLILQSDAPEVFSAGGDLKEIYQNYQEGRIEQAKSFFTDSYALNLKINTIPKPFISFVDGICMGGGMGLAMNGSHLIFSEKAQFAMPEVYIGFFPDVGARFFLKKCPGHLGLFLALTGYRMEAEDMVYAGLSQHFIPATHKEHLMNALTSVDISSDPREGINAVIELFSDVPQKESPLQKYRKEIDGIFSAESIEEMIPAMKMSKIEWMRRQATYMQAASPLSLKLTHRIFKGAVSKSLKSALAADLNLAFHFLSVPEAIEGIRALLIDKDKAPSWAYGDVYSVPDEKIEALMRGSE